MIARFRHLLGAVLAPDDRLLLAGKIERKGNRLTITGFWGTVELEGSADELDEVQRLLARMNGQDALGALTKPLADIVTALLDAGVAFDAAGAWTWFNEMTANPAPFYGLADPLEAYASPFWRFPGDARRRPVLIDPRPPRAWSRSSRLHEPDLVDPAASSAAARIVAVEAYAVGEDGARPVPSAGAMYPLHLWLLSRPSKAEPYGVEYVSEHRQVHDYRTAAADAVERAFAGDPAIDAVLKAGAAIIAVTADPGQMTAKYGNRGWRYCLIEAGAVMIRAQDIAAQQGARLRPFGGFRDEALAEQLVAPLVPIITMLVTASGAAA